MPARTYVFGLSCFCFLGRQELSAQLQHKKYPWDALFAPIVYWLMYVKFILYSRPVFCCEGTIFNKYLQRGLHFRAGFRPFRPPRAPLDVPEETRKQVQKSESKGEESKSLRKRDA